jgi:hypothetical protein
MKSEAAVCPSCQQSLPGTYCNTPAPVICPACDNAILIEIFPAFFKRTVTGQAAETIVEEGVSSCFYHERKKAVVHCDGCGRFLCSLCDVELNERHYCPACLEAGRKKGRMPHLENKRTRYDGAALSLVLLPLLFWPIVIVTAPLAIYFAILSWRRPGSIVRHTRWRAYVALVLAPLEIAGWLAFFGLTFAKFH